ncbi:hypothetical protein J7382_03195 [Shimia sp. R11_0]|uniref:hypothetical protein n=1 Tax=Shimia sp. R11_0 TaxID=2821096 RepID=UPI001ADA4884|nr:hypothetical protein [Shimia sp. R11_0]MBO9476532.1 hypothetical protein [Shimia sp. R11_0]
MKYFALVIAAVTLSACGDALTYPAEIEKQKEQLEAKAPTPVDQIQITSADTINNGNFEVLGPVKGTVGKATAFHANPTQEQAEQKLRIEAAELNADAIINASISEVKVCALSWGCRELSGTAVKLTK